MWSAVLWLHKQPTEGWSSYFHLQFVNIHLLNSHQNYRWPQQNECDSFFPCKNLGKLSSSVLSLPPPPPSTPLTSPSPFPASFLPLSLSLSFFLSLSLSLSLSFSLWRLFSCCLIEKKRQVMVHIFAWIFMFIFRVYILSNWFITYYITIND